MTSWFYKSMSERAFLTQMYFLLKRKINLEKVNDLIIKGNSIVQDYAFFKDYIYAKNFLNVKEFNIYKEYYSLFRLLNRSPSTYIYLDCEDNILMKRIKNRNRRGEEKLSLVDIKTIKRQTRFLSKKEYPNMIVVDTTDYEIDVSKKERNRLFDFVSTNILNLC